MISNYAYAPNGRGVLSWERNQNHAHNIHDYDFNVSMFTIALEIDGDSRCDAFGNHLFKVVRI